jgi:hypothetical protein
MLSALNACLPAGGLRAAALCQVVIRRTSTTPYDITNAINLLEVELYGHSGQRVPPSTVYMQLSSTFPGLDAGYCNDMVTKGGLFCHTQADDPNPSLRISYPCASGATSLSRVVVVNRETCCQERITYFTMDFVNAASRRDAASYEFVTSQPSYVIVPGRLALASMQASKPSSVVRSRCWVSRRACCSGPLIAHDSSIA